MPRFLLYPLFKGVTDSYKLQKILENISLLKPFLSEIPKRPCATRIAIRLMDIPNTTPNNSSGIQP